MACSCEHQNISTMLQDQLITSRVACDHLYTKQVTTDQKVAMSNHNDAFTHSKYNSTQVNYKSKKEQQNLTIVYDGR